MKKDFLAGISHDLKSPLASIRETLTVLLDEVPGPLVERQRRLLQLATQSGERLSAMISNLLDLAQLEARVTQYEFAPHDLAGLVRGIVAEMETRFRERDVAAELESPESLLVECDAERMAQVVQNLIDNALAVAPGGTEIRVALSSPAGYPTSMERSKTGGDVRAMNLVRLEVGDRGPGVPEELADRIFEKFQRGEGGYSQGVGLGLTISREIVVAHDGRIWLEARPGGGSVFIVEIPVTRSGDFRRDLDTRASVEAIA
jgi:signal transduction histidine kinase